MDRHWCSRPGGDADWRPVSWMCAFYHAVLVLTLLCNRCVIHTPGGGGWGEEEDIEEGPVVDESVSNGKIVYPRATGSFHLFAATQEASA